MYEAHHSAFHTCDYPIRIINNCEMDKMELKIWITIISIVFYQLELSHWLVSQDKFCLITN